VNLSFPAYVSRKEWSLKRDCYQLCSLPDWSLKAQLAYLSDFIDATLHKYDTSRKFIGAQVFKPNSQADTDQVLRIGQKTPITIIKEALE
jgi:hypothetical protein